MNKPAFLSLRRQRGISLLVVLILLLIMTLLGLAVMRGTVLEERMSANMLDRTYQFQAAESALREAEARVLAGISPPNSGCGNGICATPVAGTTDRWLDNSFSGWQRSDGTGDHDSAVTTAYLIEYMGAGAEGPNCTTPSSKFTNQTTDSLNCEMARYRISARSQADSRAVVILQSNYLVPN